MFSFLNNIPVITRNILVINVLMFILSTVLFTISNEETNLFNTLSIYYFQSPNFRPYQLVTCMFMHSQYDIMHIILNMYALVIFGSFLEKIWGEKRFLIFYVVCGLGASVFDQVVSYIEIQNITSHYSANLAMGITKVNSTEMYQYSRIFYSPSLGASGALMGVLAGFAFLFPNTELMMMFIPFPIKAKFLIGGYMFYEIYKSVNFDVHDNVGHLAHIGGALTGLILIIIRRKFDKKNFW